MSKKKCQHKGIHNSTCMVNKTKFCDKKKTIITINTRKSFIDWLKYYTNVR